MEAWTAAAVKQTGEAMLGKLLLRRLPRWLTCGRQQLNRELAQGSLTEQRWLYCLASRLSSHVSSYKLTLQILDHCSCCQLSSWLNGHAITASLISKLCGSCLRCCERVATGAQDILRSVSDVSQAVH